MGEIANRANLGHACTTLEGVQVTLQRGQRRLVVRIGQPALQRLAGALEDIDCFFEEDRHHFLVERLVQRSDWCVGQQLTGVLGNRCRQLFNVRQIKRLGQFVRRVLNECFQRSRGVGKLDDLDTGVTIVGQECQGIRVQRFQQQVAQGHYALGSTADLQASSYLIHHANQRFVGLFGFAKEALTDRQTTFLDRTIEVKQGFAEFINLRQLGHLGAASQGGQFVQQGGQLLTLGRVLAPFAQQVFSIQQDVHAFGEEDADHLRVAFHTLIGLPAIFGVLETVTVQLLYALKELGRTRQNGQRLAFQLFKTKAEEFLCAAQQLRFGQVHWDQVGFEFFDQFFQRRSNLGHRLNTGHRGAALEGVQSTLQVISDWLRQFLSTVSQEADQCIEVHFRFVTENLQQLRIEPVLILNNFAGSYWAALGLRYQLNRGLRFWEASTFGQGMCRCSQVVNIVTLTLRFIGKFIDQRRHQRDHIGDDLLYVGTRLNAAIKHTVEQVLNRPTQLTNNQGADHTTTAFEGVERATDLGQGILVFSVSTPLREKLANGLQHFTDFFDKDFQQFFINWLFISRWRQQAGRHIMSRRINRLHWSSHHISHRQRFFSHNRFCFFTHQSAGQLNFGQLECSQFSFIPVGRAVAFVQLKTAELQLFTGEGLLRLRLSQRQGVGIG